MSTKNNKNHFKALVIVESPAKAKTIKKYLGSDFQVKATLGHIKDLPPNRLGVNLADNFQPEYVVIKGRDKIIRELRKIAKRAKEIYLAPDPDREGESISWHLSQELKNTPATIRRALFHEITGKGIREGIKGAGNINSQKVNAQQARRIMDRLVGYLISPLLWRRVKQGLSAGRVQSVAVRLICEREQEIKNFQSQEYWTITARLRGEKTSPFEASLYQIEDQKADIKNEAEAKNIIQNLPGASFIVHSIKKKEQRRSPAPPFTTSKLQQEAARKLYFTARKTMIIAQQLYEGIALGKEGPVGLITYMRTDSTRIATDAQWEAAKYLKIKYGDEFVPSIPPRYKNKTYSQDAHEAIRPTSLENEPEKIKKYLSADQYSLYSLIWNRFLASQMKPAILNITTVDIKANQYYFRAIGSVVRFPGFIIIYQEEKEEKEKNSEVFLPELREGEKLILLELLPQQHFTQPPPRYNEATLVKTLEEKGIGRPSTYAPIISTIQERGYVTKREGRFYPTELGEMVNELLTKCFPTIFDVKFTAGMESQLDEIEEGKIEWLRVLIEFYEPFQMTLDEAANKMRVLKKEMEIVTAEKCEICGRPMKIKWGRHGKFLACSGFPECKNTQPLLKTIGTFCPRPECDGKIVFRTTRRGKPFYGCSNYPHCNFISWDKPINQKCPHCGESYLLEKTSKSKGPYWKCPNKSCGWENISPKDE